MDKLTFDTLCNKLNEKQIGCRVSLYKDEIEIELGFFYPDDLFFQVYDIAVSLGIQDKIEVCADSAGGPSPISQKVINGGPKSYF